MLKVPIVLVEGHQEMEDSPPVEAISPSINDLPPELLTIILEFAMLDVDRKSMLAYRLVNSQWKDVLDSVIEKKIVSWEFPTFEIFPAMYIESNVVDDQLELPVSAPAGNNPFPFNSLALYGTTINAPQLAVQKLRHVTRMILPAFATRYAENLTTFCLDGQLISIKTLNAMLGSMSNLKRLSLQVKEDDTIAELGTVFPIPPALPCLTTLDFTSLYWERDPNKIDLIYVWLIASYAEQLVRLELNTQPVPFPPLQASHEYTHAFPGGQTCSIATTSEVAFRKLKELVVVHRSREFYSHSETPALRRLTVCSEEDSTFDEDVTQVPFHLEDVITFIDKCSNTLDTFIMKMPWEEIRTGLNQLEPPMAVGAFVPRLKSLTVRYPVDNTSEAGLKNFLVKLPGLKTLKLTVFRPHEFDHHITIIQNQNGDNEANKVFNESNQNADEIVTLKDRLVSIFEQMTTDDRKRDVAYAAIDGLIPEAEEDDEVIEEHEDIEEHEAIEDDDQMKQLELEIDELTSTLSAAGGDRAAIFRRLSDLGENKEKVMVQQLLERVGFWSTCPSLQTLSVSSGEKPDGNIFLVQREDSA